MKTLTLILALASSLAFGQADICRQGMWCKTWKLSTSSTTSLAAGCFVSGSGANNVGCDTVFSTNRTLTMGTNGRIYLADGTAALPSATFSVDPNTGFFSRAADNLGITTGGVEWGYFSSTPGIIVGNSAAAQLEISGTRSRLTYSTAYLEAGPGPAVTINAGSGYTNFDNTSLRRNDTGALTIDDAQGVALVGVAAASLPASGAGTAQALQTDTGQGRLWYRRTTTNATTPWVDLAGSPHGVLERHYWELTAGMESAVQHQWYPRAPFIGAAAVGLPTYVDAAGATTVQLGTTPNVFDARGSVTLAAAASTSTMLAPLIVRTASRAPRWCAKVALSSATSIRSWVGLTSALPGATDNPATSHVSFRYSTNASDSKWQYCFANGVSTTCADTGVPPNTSGFETLCIDCREGGSTACNFWVNGAVVGRVTSGLPTGFPLGPFYTVEALAASARTIWAGSISVEVN